MYRLSGKLTSGRREEDGVPWPRLRSSSHPPFFVCRRRWPLLLGDGSGGDLGAKKDEAGERLDYFGEEFSE